MLGLLHGTETEKLIRVLVPLEASVIAKILLLLAGSLLSLLVFISGRQFRNGRLGILFRDMYIRQTVGN